MEQAPTSRRVRRGRRQDLPEVILAAAARCFERWGIERTRVADIAVEADVPRPHIYRHYASKDAIVHAVILRAIQRHHERLSERFPADGDPHELILNTLLSGIRDAAHEVESLTRADSVHATARSLASSPEILGALREHWEPILTRARKLDKLRRHVEIDRATNWLVKVQLSYLALGEPEAPDQLADELRDFVLPALLVDEPSR